MASASSLSAEEASQDHYLVLSLAKGPQSSSREITLSFRTLALALHPDKIGTDLASKALFEKVRLAKETLLDPAKRALFDDVWRERQRKRDREMKEGEDIKAMKRRLEEAEARARFEAQHAAARTARNGEIERIRDQGVALREALTEQRFAEVIATGTGAKSGASFSNPNSSANPGSNKRPYAPVPSLDQLNQRISITLSRLRHKSSKRPRP